jgi:hypothetical protein
MKRRKRTEMESKDVKAKEVISQTEQNTEEVSDDVLDKVTGGVDKISGKKVKQHNVTPAR